MDDRPHMTVDEYVRLEDLATTKHEYFDGQMIAMTGGTIDHARLAAALTSQLSRQLEGRPCAVYSSDARVRVFATGLITYPDITVGCGPVETDGEDKLAQTNPTVLVEVTSDSSERYDRGSKCEHYKRIASLREYVIVSHRERAIDVFSRGDDGTWSLRAHGGAGDRVTLPSIGCTIDVDSVYRDPRAMSS